MLVKLVFAEGSTSLDLHTSQVYLCVASFVLLAGKDSALFFSPSWLLPSPVRMEFVVFL